MTETTLPVIERFNEATNRHDVDGMMALLSDDVVFESTSALMASVSRVSKR